MTALAPQRFLPSFQVVFVVLMLFGLIAWNVTSYYLIVVPALLPTYFWIRAGAPGLPSLSILAALAIIYYAIPILRWSVPSDDPKVIVTAALTIASFLFSAALVYRLFLPAAERRAGRHQISGLENRGALKLAAVGIVGGLLYFVCLFAGWLGTVGTYTGLIRAVAYTFAAIGCYIVGSARGVGTLKGVEWVLALIGLISLSAFGVAGLLLFGGVLNAFAFVLGYIVAARRIPWLLLAAIFIVISILQAGKFDMRDKYWDPNEVSGTGLGDVPGRIIEWLAIGTNVLLHGREETDVLERATLLQAVVLVQQETPQVVPFLEGETYALLPSMLMPRFIDSEKIVSQAGLNLLSVRYGLQTVEATETTTIAWGLIAEAWANFGFIAVPVVGALLGLLCGAITLVSSGVPLISVRMFTAIAAMAALLDVEADLSYILVTMFQSVGVVFLVGGSFAIVRRMLGHAPRVSDRAVISVGRPAG